MLFFSHTKSDQISPFSLNKIETKTTGIIMEYYLYHIEYQIKSIGQSYTCKCVGTNRDDILKDIVNQIGEIRVLNFYYMSEVHRITGTIRKQIMEGSLKKEKSKKMGRPRKYEFIGE